MGKEVIVMRKKRISEKGELTIEAVIVVTVTIFIIFLTLDIALAVYRQANVSITANKAAASIGNVYSFQYKDPSMAYQGEDGFKKYNLYRSFGRRTLNEETIKKAIWYAGYSLKKTELSSEEPDYRNEIQASIDTNAIGNPIITVTITRKYQDFFLTPVSWLGIDPYYTCSANGTAQCYDVIGYVNEKTFRKEIYDEIGASNPITSTIDQLISTVKTLAESIKNVLN